MAEHSGHLPGAHDSPPPADFRIKARDRFAVPVIEQWILRARASGLVSAEKIADAETHRDIIAAWQRNNWARTKVPD